MKKAIVMTVLGAATILGAMTCASAAELTSYNDKCVVETPDNGNWAEVRDPETVMTLSDGADRVTIKEFTKDDTLKPVLSDSAFEEVYQTFYSTKDAVYEITGYAVNVNSIDEVRSVVESFQLKDHMKKAEQKAEQKTEEKQEQKKEQKEEDGATVHILYSEDGTTSVEVSMGKDGIVRDKNGVVYEGIADGCMKDQYGNRWYDVRPVKEEEKNYFTVYSEDGEEIQVYTNKEGIVQDNTGKIMEGIADGCLQDQYGNRYYDVRPTGQGEKKTYFTLFDENNDPLYVYTNKDGVVLDDTGRILTPYAEDSYTDQYGNLWFTHETYPEQTEQENVWMDAADEAYAEETYTEEFGCYDAGTYDETAAVEFEFAE